MPHFDGTAGRVHFRACRARTPRSAAVVFLHGFGEHVLNETVHREVAAASAEFVLSFRAADERVGFCDATLSWDVVANVHEGARLTGWRTGFPDLYATPDLDTFRLLPWRPGAGQVLGDIVDHEGNPVRTAPRTVLRRVTERLAELGYHAEIGVEIEFFLLDPAAQPLATAVHCYSLEKLNELDPVLTSITRGLAGYLPVEAVTSEYGPGQLEINIHHRDPLGAADDAFRLKYALRALARAAGARVTFMAKPFQGLSGSSMHLHVAVAGRRAGVRPRRRGGEPADARGHRRRAAAPAGHQRFRRPQHQLLQAFRGRVVRAGHGDLGR